MSPHKCGSSKMSIATGLRIWFEANMKLSQYLVGGFNHLEKYDFVNGKDYSHWWKIKFQFMESANQICSHIFPCFQYFLVSFPAMFPIFSSHVFQCFHIFQCFQCFHIVRIKMGHRTLRNRSSESWRMVRCVKPESAICGAQKNAMFVGL